MKNIHILPTDKPSRLLVNKENTLVLTTNYYSSSTPQNIYITSDEEIKEGDWCICLENIFKNEIFKVDSDTPNKSSNVTLEFAKKYLTKIILTTDQDLIEDGVQAINDEFLEWFVKNPSCEEVEVEKEKYDISTLTNDIKKYPNLDVPDYKIIIPKEEPKQETLEEAAENYVKEKWEYAADENKESFINGAKWQAERDYSEAIEFGKWLDENMQQREYYPMSAMTMEELFEQFKNK